MTRKPGGLSRRRCCSNNAISPTASGSFTPTSLRCVCAKEALSYFARTVSCFGRTATGKKAEG